MSRMAIFQHACIQTRENMGEYLDLSRESVIRIVNTLESKGYIEKTKITFGDEQRDALRSTHFIQEVASSSEVGQLMFGENKNLILMTAKIEAMAERAGIGLSPKTDRRKAQYRQPKDRGGLQIATDDGCKLPPSTVANCHHNYITELPKGISKMSLPENSGSDGGGEPDPDSGEENPHLPAIPEENPNPQVPPAPLPRAKTTKKRATPPTHEKTHGYTACVDTQDAYMKANGHPGVHMTAGEGKCLKTLLSRLKEYALADIRERGHAEPENTEDLPARYLKFLHMHGATMRDFDRSSLLKFSSILGNLPSLTAHAREQERKARQPKQESVPTIKTKSIYTDV